MASRCGVVWRVTLSALATHLVVLLGTAHAGPACKDDSSVTPGFIRDKWDELGGSAGPLGCALSDEHDVVDGDGQFRQFLHGQIVWSPTPRLIVAAYERSVGDGGSANISVDFDVKGSFSYDFFVVRWTIEGEGSDQSDLRQPGKHGVLTLLGQSGRFGIRVEGCDNGGFLQSSDCKQGFSNPVVVDAGYIDVGHTWDGRDLLPATSVAETKATLHDRHLLGILRSCRRGFAETTLDENNAATALFKLDGASSEVAAACLFRPPSDTAAAQAELWKSVNDWLKTAEIKSEVGTGFGTREGAIIGGAEGGLTGALIGGLACGPLCALAGAAVGGAVGIGGGTAVCSRSGEYDFALTHLIPVMYEYGPTLDGAVRQKVLTEFLNQTGGRDQVITKVNRCGIGAQETENHVMMIESARYLTNPLRLKQAEQDFPPGSNELQDAIAKFDNSVNGLEDWMLQHLQGFLMNDFHEYNARPYERYTIKALQNLANYAGPRVAVAASMVLDYEAARFAVSTDGLRRAAAFRRRAENKDKSELLGRHSDEDTWRFAVVAGDTDVLLSDRFGHAPWNAWDIMAFPRESGPSGSRYALPDPIIDLMVHKNDHAYWQRIRHEGVEVYAATPDYLISGGGRWEPSENRDELRLFGVNTTLSGPDTKGQALPIVLIPTFGADDRNGLIRLDGHSDDKKRLSTCVAPNFACGLNPVIPHRWIDRFQVAPRPCSIDVAGIVRDEWVRLGADGGVLGCPVNQEHDATEGSGRVQDFERGEIVWSIPQKMVLTAYYSRTDSGLILEWRITDQFSYDYFNVRWDRDGANIGQHAVQNDDANASPTGGGWNVPTEEVAGRYRLVVEGCDGHFLRKSTCRRGFSSPVTLDFPSLQSCARANGNFWFIDAAAGTCGPEGELAGFFAAVYSAPCERGLPCEGQHYGFFEVSQSDDLTLDTFAQTVLANNAGKSFSSIVGNEYKMLDGTVMHFLIDHGRDDSGIIDINGQAADAISRVDQWHLAKGDVIDADGRGCVVIRNKPLGRALIFNMRDWQHPARSETALSPGTDMTCNAVP